jgi:hypothetical protein
VQISSFLVTVGSETYRAGARQSEAQPVRCIYGADSFFLALSEATVLEAAKLSSALINVEFEPALVDLLINPSNTGEVDLPLFTSGERISWLFRKVRELNADLNRARALKLASRDPAP